MALSNSWEQVKALNAIPLHQLILDQLDELMANGTLKPGDTLPPERLLSEKMNVSRGTLREAFRILEHQGIIETRAGGGRRLRHLPSGTFSLSPEEYISSLRRAAAVDLMEAQQALEERIVELACERASVQDLERIREALYESGAPNEAEVSITFNRGNDQAFHLAIATATHNFVFIRMMHLHLDLVKEIREMLLTEERRKEMDAEHEAIYEAIAARDPVMARAAIVHHREKVIDLLKNTS